MFFSLWKTDTKLVIWTFRNWIHNTTYFLQTLNPKGHCDFATIIVDTRNSIFHYWLILSQSFHKWKNMNNFYNEFITLAATRKLQQKTLPKNKRFRDRILPRHLNWQNWSNVQLSVAHSWRTIPDNTDNIHLYLNQYQFKLKNHWKINLVKNDIFHTKQMNREEFSVQPYKWYVFLQLCDQFVSCVKWHFVLNFNNTNHIVSVDNVYQILQNRN